MKRDIFKKVICGVIVVILAFMASLSFSIFKYAKGETSFGITFDESVMIEKISLNSNDYNLKSFVRDNLHLNDKKDRLVADGQGNIIVQCNIVDDFYVKFSGEKSNIIVTKDGVEQELSENDYLYIVNIKDIISNSISTSTLIYFIAFLPLMVLLVYGLKYVFGKIRENNLKVYDILLYIAIVFTIYLLTFYAFSLILRKFIFLPIALFICYAIYLVINSNDKKYENIYVIFAVIAGISIVFLMAPFNVPDEASHYLRSYKESTLSFEYDGGYYKFPKAITEFIYKYNRNLHDSANKIYAENYLSEFTKDVDYSVESMYETDYRNVVDLSVIPYVPSAIVIFFARFIHLSPLVMFLLSRLVNLTLSILGCYWAIKNVPCFKKVFTLVCLFPIYLQQACAINMDYFTNLIVIMLISLIFQMIYKLEKVGKREIILLTIFSIGLTLGKFGYFPVLALLFLVPKEKFNNKLVEWIIKVGFILVVLVSSLMMNLQLATEQGTAPGQGLEVYGIKSFFTTPFTALKVIVTTVIARIDQDIFRGFFDNFAYSTIAHKAIFPVVMYFVYILLLFSKDEEDDVELLKVHRVFYVGISLAIIAIVYAIAYSQWTKYGAAEISGLQARYFIATSTLLYIGASNSLLNINVKNKKILYTVLMATSLIISVITIGNFFS